MRLVVCHIYAPIEWVEIEWQTIKYSQRPHDNISETINGLSF